MTRAALVVLFASLGVAGDDARELKAWTAIDHPWETLELADGFGLSECPRRKGDTFPYWAAARGSARRAQFVTPKNIAQFLKRTDGKVIVNERQAFELVRTFVAGPLLTSRKDVERIVAAAGDASEVKEYRPPTFAPMTVFSEGTWTVSLVALDITARLQVVHVTATVDAAGRIAWKRKLLLDGPPLSSNRAHDTMLRCLKAARLETSVETAWVLARTLRKFADLRRVLGDPTKTWRTTATIWEYGLPDGSKVTFVGKDEFDGVMHIGTVKDRTVRSVVRTFRQ